MSVLGRDVSRIGRRQLVTLAASAILASCTHIGGGAPPTAAAGRAFAFRACAGCHALGFVRESPYPSAPSFAALNRRFRGAELEMALRGVSNRGHIEMPPIYMTDDEIRAVAAYIRSSDARVARGPQASTRG